MLNSHIDGFELGQKTLEPIFTSDGHLLVNEGTIVSYDLVKKLKKHNIQQVKTLHDLALANQRPTVSKEQVEASICAVEMVFTDVLEGDQLTAQTSISEEHIHLVKEVVSKLMITLSTSTDLLYTVTELMNTDIDTYRHSVNVAILSILTAKSMGYVTCEIEEIALGALLHDIGKALVPGGLVTKTGKLTENEVFAMKEHPQLGFDMVKDLNFLPYAVKQIIRYHHEKLDGSGYPYGISGLRIPRYVRIVTLCDMYDAMTSNRSYRKRMPIYTALEILMKDAIYKLDPEVYRHMTSRICLYPTGLGVILSDDRIGIIHEYRHSNPTRPVIELVEFSKVKGSVQTSLLDLQKEKTLFIVDTWHVDDFNRDFRKVLQQETFNDLPSEERERYVSSLS